jgi:hypothetical protein
MSLWSRSILLGLISVLGLYPQLLLPKQQPTNVFNVPDELRACLKTKPELEINWGINPFYIGGDFDGDSFTDFAVQVETIKDQRHGVLLCLAKRGSVLIGAGAPFLSIGNLDKWPFDSWMLVRKGSKRLSIYRQIKFDALALFNGDAAGELVYWDGRKFVEQGGRFFLDDSLK